MGKNVSTAEGETACRDTSVLPPDGRLIRVSQWRQQIVWLCFGGFALLYVNAAVHAFLAGSVYGVLLGLGLLVGGGISLRVPTTGLILEKQGVKVRSPLWTRHYAWGEIGCFELVGHPVSPYMHRLRIHLLDGGVKKARGFFARGHDEEARQKILFQALQERLRHERQEGELRN